MPLANPLNEVFVFIENGMGIRSLWSAAEIYGDIANVTPEDIPFFLCADSDSENFEAIAEGLAKADPLNKITYLLCGYIAEKRFFPLGHGTYNVPSEVFKRLISNHKSAGCLLEYFAEKCATLHA